MTTKELRQKYLDFFASKDHAVVSSASLIPENDPTTLFTGSGMQPMVPYLLGETHPMGGKITDSQKCFRAVDMDEVGDSRHTTFFEMLGNWSLGSYFKKEQINWMWTFLVEEIGVDPKRLYITCFRGREDIGIPRDEETAKLWQEHFTKICVEAEIVDNAERDGLQDGRIFYYDATKNWWSRAGIPEHMPVGEPGGPDSEMFWDFGEELGLHEKTEWAGKPCHVNCDCGRFIEIGNNVFMAYKKTEHGFEELTQQNVDFGGGLERMAMALLDDPDIFKIDLFAQSRKILEKITNKKYGEEKKETYAFRVILDHLRAATFLIADGAVPSNKDQGYFTRRLIRRAVRFGNELGASDLFTSDISQGFITTYKDTYIDLVEKQDLILFELTSEETKFRSTLESGMKEFEKLLKGFEMAYEKTGNKITEISGKQAFKLYDTYGFPYEMTEELAREHGLNIDKKEFDESFEKHRNLSREGAEQKFKGGLADTGEMSVKYHTATHLLHAALRKILGDHVEQKGSNITAERLRFDFTHPDKMTDEEKKKVEDLINSVIAKNYPVSYSEMTVDEARKKGAIGLFGDKYGAKVKVYTVGDPGCISKAEVGSPTFSMEICGGPHVEHTGVLGKFIIKKEESSSAGIRRIKATLE
ncbi:MAG: alanine--tRNA ligase [Candidatus Magasanikbacteria bacterium CG_4_10_14_0_2_um_filter_37_12]|uniref:Alanine--tRNA ligase n=1 Tax=Candidatus Magasanikbacteria bacterium CG_4_10_14_0_2_um_filter_37_12 TaxID=1974637 RepID=A0A2M7V8Z4_9BACT|nr:MAG: alanine--tRNA ligase [Candidatus Magasanikbacteria bacterium CG_4_10_14_0_2_um_filter_37_12]